MRFIFNFIFFGLLFYAIYYFFPDAFGKLVIWAKDLFDYIKNFFQQIFNGSGPIKKENLGFVFDRMIGMFNLFF